MTDILVRTAGPADAAELARLNRLFNGIGAAPETIAAQMQRSAGVERVLLAEVGGRAVGFACLRLVPTALYRVPYAELTELYVDADYRRRGAGRALVAQAEALAREAGALELLLLTGFQNAGARAFYRAIGYADYALALRRRL